LKKEAYSLRTPVLSECLDLKRQQPETLKRHEHPYTKGRSHSGKLVYNALQDNRRQSHMIARSFLSARSNSTKK